MSRKRRRSSSSSASSAGSGSRGASSDIDDTNNVREEIGIGTFGKVFRCVDQKYKDTVALKVVRNIKKYVNSAKIEAQVLNDIYHEQKRQGFDGCVKIYSHFKFNGHYCMVTERLGVSLYDLLKKRSHRGLPIDLVRDIAKQLLSALEFLHSFDLIHTDLKVENILFASPELDYGSDGIPLPTSPKIKLIDFGGATYDDEHKTRVICTRQYRGPEVILGLGWSFPADVWSAGCIICEIYSGELFFATHENKEHLALIEAAVRAPYPSWMCKRADPEFKDIFDRKGSVLVDECLPPDSARFVHKTEGLRHFFSEHKDTGIIDLMKGVLEIDPETRLSARNALFQGFLRDPRGSDRR